MADQLFNVQEVILKKTVRSDSDPEMKGLLDTPVSGYDFNKGINYPALLQTYLTTGFQATSFGQAIKQIEMMVRINLVFQRL